MRLERLSEIQYQNRILLKKMLQIDLKPKSQIATVAKKAKKQLEQPAESNPNGLNSYGSLNRANRIKDLAKIVDDNKQILKRLQDARSHYSAGTWDRDFFKQQKVGHQI